MAEFVRKSDGVHICYKQRGLGTPAIIFVHGWSCDKSYWSEQFEHFGRTYRVVAIDLGGHGESVHDRGDWTIEAYAQDVRRVVEHLFLTDVVLVGHSMGGPVVVDAARALTGHVRGVVAVDYFHNVEAPRSESRLAEELAAFRTDFRARTDALVRTYFRPDTDSSLIERIVSDMASAPSVVAIPSLESIRRHDAAKSLSGLTCPMAIINSDFWPTSVEELRRCNPSIRVSIIPNTDHFLMLDRPREFNSALEDVLCEWTRPGYP